MPKNLFGTTEKSNFILNMSPVTLQKWVAAMLMICIIVPQLGSFIIEAFQINNSLMGAFLYLSGFGSVLFFIIAMLKKEQSFKENPVYIPVIILPLLAFASYYKVFLKGGDASNEMVRTALEGELGRYEGLLSIIAYAGIFLLATVITKKKTVNVLLDTIVGIGIVQAVIAVFQHIPGLNFLTSYADLPTMALKNVMLSSGLSESPIFYGTFLTIVSGVAFIGAIYDENVIRARIYGAAALLFVLTGLFTSSIVPIIGMGCVILLCTITVLLNRKTEFDNGVLKTPVKRYAALIAASAVIVLAVVLIQGIYIRDKEIAFFDAYFRLFIVNNFSPVDKRSLYEIAWGRSIDIIKENLLLGVGPDCMAKYQINSKELLVNIIDKSYNEYLYIAATRGIISAVAFVAFAVMMLIRGVKNFGKFSANKNNWYIPALLISVGAYLVQAFFSASTVSTAPLFWLLAGILCARKIEEEKIPKLKKKNK